MTLVRTREQFKKGVTCACGHAFPPSTLYRLTCPRCQQVLIARPDVR